MGSPNWGTDRSITELLFTAGFEFDFFQAVCLLARFRHELRPVGTSVPPSSEVVRFRARNSLSFPPSCIHSVEEDSGGPPYMTVAFLGLTGPKGILPTHYTERVIEEECTGSLALSEFFNIFNHRLISLFYRAWEKHHFPIGYERAQRTETAEDDFTQYLFDLIGMGTGGLRRRLPFNDELLLRYAGLFAQRPHSASALAGILSDYFGVPAVVEPFQPRRHQLESQDLCYPRSQSPSNQLGMGAVAGDAVWTMQATFRVRIGPLTLEQYREFLPDGKAFIQAEALIRLFAERPLEFEIQPVLKKDEVPLCELTRDLRNAPRLGWLGWLKVSEFRQDARDAIFSAAAHHQHE
jgi:type VI secretion system protein ImpH